jgi:hypothetical protein
MKKDQVLRLLRKSIDSNFGSKLNAARCFGISVSQIDRILRGESAIRKNILDYMSLAEKETEYMRIR